MSQVVEDAQRRVCAAAKKIYPGVGEPYPTVNDLHELQIAVESLRKIEAGDEAEIDYRETVREMGYGVPGWQK